MKVTAESPGGEEATITLKKDGTFEIEGLSEQLSNTFKSIEDYRSVERASDRIPQEGLLQDGEKYNKAGLSEKSRRVEELFTAVGWEVTDVSEE